MDTLFPLGGGMIAAPSLITTEAAMATLIENVVTEGMQVGYWIQKTLQWKAITLPIKLKNKV